MPRRRGFVLAEIIAAMTIFAFAALGCITLLSQLSETESRAHRLERTVFDQSRLLTAYALLSREDLDRRLGTRHVGPYLIEVQRPEPSLYRVAIGDSTGTDLVTLLHRPGRNSDVR